MASYHLSVKTVKRSAGRTATACAAYRAGEEIACEREGRVHDYSRKQGVVQTFVVAAPEAPDWALDRGALWNAAEAREVRRNAVTAREWEVALPSELSADARAGLARDFAQALVDRYGVVADVALHAPHREGDQRNHHAHILTTTRTVGAEGFGAKTRVLDAAKTGGAEIEALRGVWAALQNRALERDGQAVRVDHRSLEVQREAALGRDDALAAAALDRAPEIKLGPATTAMERKALRAASEAGTAYRPVTERGAQNHPLRQQRDLLSDLRQRAEQAREAYRVAREQEAGRVEAAAEAVRSLFAPPQNDAFARGFEGAWQTQEGERHRVLAQEREQERLRQREEKKALFIEDTAHAWQATRQMRDHDVAKEKQGDLAASVERTAKLYGVRFNDLAQPIDKRANEIRTEQEKQRERERTRQREAERDRGWER